MMRYSHRHWAMYYVIDQRKDLAKFGVHTPPGLGLLWTQGHRRASMSKRYVTYSYLAYPHFPIYL